MLAVVTGANGFIGQHLSARLLEQGWTVRPLARPSSRPSQVSILKSEVSILPVTYSDPLALSKAVEAADVVFHCAGATRAPTPRELFRANVDLTRGVLSACETSGVKRFVLVSSQAAAGPARSATQPVTEDDISAPMESYGTSKRDAELAVKEEGRRLPYTIVRPAAVYGPADRDFLQMFRSASMGLAVHGVDRKNLISIVYVRDLVDGMIVAATKDVAIGRTYFLANDDPVSWGELFTLAAQVGGKRITLELGVPKVLADVAGEVGDVFGKLTGHTPLMSSEKIALGRPPFWICSNARAKKELGFAPKTELRTGLSETYDWYRENRWL